MLQIFPLIFILRSKLQSLFPKKRLRIPLDAFYFIKEEFHLMLFISPGTCNSEERTAQTIKALLGKLF